MSDKMQAIEEEIRKLEDRLQAMQQKEPQSKQMREIREATLTLLKDAVSDLRAQQKKLRARSPSKEGVEG